MILLQFFEKCVGVRHIIGVHTDAVEILSGVHFVLLDVYFPCIIARKGIKVKRANHIRPLLDKIMVSLKTILGKMLL